MNQNVVENYIVQMGISAAEALALGLKSLSGLARGIAAMCLIRIGEDSIPYLRREAIKDNNSSWIYNYLIQEIECK